MHAQSSREGIISSGGPEARTIVEKYYSKLTLDFQMNKKIAEEVATIPSKRMRNKIAGFTTHLMKRIMKGPVRGISLKLQVCRLPRSALGAL